MSKNENKPAVEGLDFNCGYEVHNPQRKPFPGKNNEEPRVIFESEVFEELKQHAGETVAVELCGVLVGTTRQDDSGRYLVINGSIRGKHARNEGAQVAFTHETWDYIHAEMEKNFKGRAIVGWYHTHPGFGIFLSDMDKFIQDYFFNQPFQVALVIDPINSKEGLFAWVEGKTRALSRCWIGEEVHKLTQGAVGSEEIREKFPAQASYAQQNDTPTMPAKKEDKPGEEMVSYRFLPLALAFFIGLSIASLMLRSTFFQAAMIASRAETRELLGAWASDSAASEELQLLQGKMNALSASYAKMLESSPELAGINASFAADIADLQVRLSEIASGAINRRSKVQSILETATNQTLRNAQQSEEVMKKLRQAMAQSLLTQLMPFLYSLSVSPPDINQLGEAKILIQHIIGLDPRLEPGLKEKLPWLF